MALINCCECKAEISSKAKSCPKCGCPVKSVQTIEKTGKRYKLQILISLGGGLLSFFLMAVLSDESNLAATANLAIFFGLVGTGLLVWFLVVQFLIWWHHG